MIGKKKYRQNVNFPSQTLQLCVWLHLEDMNEILLLCDLRHKQNKVLKLLGLAVENMLRLPQRKGSINVVSGTRRNIQ